MDLGTKIKSLREAAGLTQEELGRRCGTTKQTIFKYESGIVSNIPLSRLGMIAKALNTTVNEMIDGDWSGIDMSDAFAPEAKKEPAPISESGSNKARLLAILNQLSDTNQAQLLSYAEFLKDSERK